MRKPSAKTKPLIEQSDNSLVRLVNTTIIDAHAQGVSDIHFETMPGRDKLRIRFRKDGVLKPYLELPHTYRQALVARIKIMCDLDISEKRKPQDGKINFAKFSPQHKHRAARGHDPDQQRPRRRGAAPARVDASRCAMDQLGLSAGNYKRLRAAIERPYGMVLCVGPTGSGKTTTLHSALGQINTAERKIWTAEDPIEITQAGLRQVQVNPKIDWTFAKALRAFLRADPDVIMVGEIRDAETARTAIEASLTGHLVLSTLHTNSAPRDRDAPARHGHGPVQLRRLAAGRAGTAPGAAAVPALPHGARGHARRRSTNCCRITSTPFRPSCSRAARTCWPTGGRASASTGALLHYEAPGCEHCEDTGLPRPRGNARVAERDTRVAPPDPDRRPRRGAAAPGRWPTACARCARTASRRFCRASPRSVRFAR